MDNEQLMPTTNLGSEFGLF